MTPARTASLTPTTHPHRRVAALWLVVGLAGGCGSSPAPIVPTPIPVPPAAAWEPGGAPSASPTSAAATIDPDVPAGADAIRDAALQADAAAIFEAYLDTVPRLSPDGKKVVFRSNRDGMPQLYVADAGKPEAKATRLVTTSERVVDPVMAPDGKHVYFLSDKGADENFSIFRVGLDGGGLVELTPGEKLHRDAPFLPEGAPDTMFFTAIDVKEKAGRIYSASLGTPGPAKLVYRDPSTAFVADVSRDGKWALVIRVLSLSDQKLLRVDLQTGTASLAYPPEGKSAGISDARVSVDQGRVLVATDGGGEQGLVLALDAKTFAETGRYTETSPKTAHVSDLALSRKGDLVALRVGAGNHAEIRLLDQKTLKPAAKVAMPLGTGGAPHFSDDGKTLAVHWSTPSTPMSLFAIDTATGKVRPLHAEVRPTLAKLPKLDASLAEVTSFDKTKVPVNVYLPSPLKKGTKLPTVVIVHGGPAGSFEIRWSTFTRFYSSHGWAVVEPNVRGSTGFGRAYEQADDHLKRMDSVRDLEEVGKWAAAQPWSDPSKLVVLGGSYGGYMTLMGVTHQPQLWKAGVDIFGIYDWRTFMKTTAGVIRDLFQREIGPETDQAFLASISPSNKIDQVVAPLFVYAGQNDPRVPRAESDSIVASLRKRKVPVEYMVAANEGHSLDRKESITSFLARSQRFLEKHLSLPAH